MKKQKLPVEVTLNGSSSFILLVNKPEWKKVDSSIEALQFMRI